jgi:hypothetical protein
MCPPISAYSLSGYITGSRRAAARRTRSLALKFVSGAGKTRRPSVLALGCGLECALEFARSTDLQSVELHAQRVRRGCQLSPVRYAPRPECGNARQARQRLAEKL